MRFMKVRSVLMCMLTAALLCTALTGCLDKAEQEPELISLTFPHNGKETFNQGEAFVIGNLVVKANYSNGSNRILEDYEIEPPIGTILDTAGYKTVTVSYGNKKKSYVIHILEKSSGKPDNPNGQDGPLPVVSLSEYTISDSLPNNIKIEKDKDYTLQVKFTTEGAGCYKEITLSSDSEYLNVYKTTITDAKRLETYTTEFKFSGSSKIPYEKDVQAVLKLSLHYQAETYSQVEWLTKDYDIKLTCNSGNIPISKQYWGTWIQMDTGKEFYIDCENIYNVNSNWNGTNYYTEYQKGISGYTLDGENVLCNGNTRFFRKGGSVRNFSVKVSGFDAGSSSRAAGSRAVSDFNSIKLKRVNQKNFSDTEAVSLDANGNAVFVASVADDEQKLTIIPDIIGSGSGSGTEDESGEGSETELSAVIVTPDYNGENMGTIPIVEEGKYGFKVTHKIDSDEQKFCFGNNFKTYTLKLNLNNVGTAVCSTSIYTISCDDPNLEFIDSAKEGNFSSIEPGKSKELTLKVRYGNLDKESIDVPVNISITDSTNNLTWNDSVTLRFYKGVVGLKVNAHNIDSSTSSSGGTSQTRSLKGFLMYPDGRSKWFTVPAETTSTVWIPWSKSDYILAFTGATSESEMAYSFGFKEKTELADLSGLWTSSDINAYEKYNDVTTNSVANPYNVTDLSKPVKAYLQLNDLDFYKINCGSLELNYTPVAICGYQLREDGYSNCKDDLITPGETHSLDILMKNESSETISNLDITLSTECEYVTINRDSYYYSSEYTKIPSENYFSLIHGASATPDNVLFKGSTGYAFNFLVSKECPLGTKIPFTITFKRNADGLEWIENIDFYVDTPDVSIEIAKFACFDLKDDCVNPGDKIYLAVCIHNTGKSNAEGLTSKLSVASEYKDYINFSDNICNYGELPSGYYTRKEDSCSDYCYASDLSKISMNDWGSAVFEFTISDSVPYGTEIPFTLNLTDKYGIKYSDSITIAVIESIKEVKLNNYKISDRTLGGTMNDNDKKIEPGEEIYLNACVKNTGTVKIEGLKVSFTTASEYLTLKTWKRDYGNLPVGKYASYYIGASDTEITDLKPEQYGALIFSVSSSTPAGTVIPIQIRMEDSSGDYWTDEIKITVEKAD